MIAEFIITFREALEVSLIIGIILAYLERTKGTQYNKHVYLGLAAGLVASAVVGFLFTSFGTSIEAMGLSEEVFEGAVILVAVAMITWMILWMLHQKHIRHYIEERVRREIDKKYAVGLVLFTFVSVLREGFETIVFLGATAFTAGALSVIGALGGVAAAVVLAFILFEAIMKVNIKLFFNVTSILLILFAAGLSAHAAHEFQEGGLLPEEKELWNTKNILDDKSVLG